MSWLACPAVAWRIGSASAATQLRRDSLHPRVARRRGLAGLPSRSRDIGPPPLLRSYGGTAFTFALLGEGWWQDPESNRGHVDFQSTALPTELSCPKRE